MPNRRLLTAALAACALALTVPAHAAAVDKPLDCVSLTQDLQSAKAEPTVVTHVYRGFTADLFLKTAIEVYGEPPVDLSAVKVIATFVIGTDQRVPVQIRFYDAAYCIIWAVTTQAGGLAEIIMQMGPAI